MNPGRPFEREALKKTQSLKQCLSKPLGDKTPQNEVGSGKKEQHSKEDIIKEVDHRTIERLKSLMAKFVRSDEPKVNQCQIKSKAQIRCRDHFSITKKSF
jgi:hypothetical protein